MWCFATSPGAIQVIPVLDLGVYIRVRLLTVWQYFVERALEMLETAYEERGRENDFVRGP